MSASSLAEPIPVAVPVEKADAPQWSLAARIAFRFFFSFLLLSYLPFPLVFLDGPWQTMWEAVVGRVGPALFGLTVDATFNGSGDRAFHWVQLFVTAVAAVAATLIWSMVDRRRASYPRLHAWFHVYIRFALAAVMITYGAFKVIPSQFSPPSLDRLAQPFGDASPMGLLWTFMGASMAYTIFTGIGEMVGGLLLTIRRTHVLGALISAAVMTHVVVLNFCYDVPVKIFSTLLLVTALVILAPHAKQLALFFTREDKPLVTRPWLRITARVLIAIAVVFYTGMLLRQSIKQRTVLAGRSAFTPIYGIWNVDELTVDGVSRPPLTTDATRWRRLIVAGKEWGAIQLMDDSRTRYMLELTGNSLTLKKRTDPKFLATFNTRRPDPNTLLLDGTFEGKTITATLRKAGDERKFLLNSRGFHWINDVPFNR